MNTHILIQKSLALMLILFALTACNQQEFYEKEFLEGVGIPDDEVIPESSPDQDSRVASDDEEYGSVETPKKDENESNSNDDDQNTSRAGDQDDSSSSDNSDSNVADNSNGSDNGSNDGSDNNSGNNTGDNSGSNSGGNSNDGSNGGSNDVADGSDDSDDNSGDNSGDNGSNDDNTDVTDGSNGSDGDNEGEGETTEPGICGDGTLTDTNDQFVQNSAEQAKVDILWVMDNSGSMQDEQDALAYNFNAFISNFIEKNIDFKMAVTTTDGSSYSKSGRMHGNSDDLTAIAAAQNQNKFMRDFSEAIKVGTYGSGTEMGLETSRSFFDRYRDWARDDAFLIVVYISDEEDHSKDRVSEYISALQSLKGSAGKVKAYSIVTQEIKSSKQWETIGNRYMEVSRATGGEIADIHQDFHQILSGFGFKILDLLDSFPLSGVPVGTEISVTVNNQQLSSGWTYDENSRSIKFDANTIPDEGEIIIAYYQKCVMPN
jgi:hypothetical protein